MKIQQNNYQQSFYGDFRCGQGLNHFLTRRVRRAIENAPTTTTIHLQKPDGRPDMVKIHLTDKAKGDTEFGGLSGDLFQVTEEKVLNAISSGIRAIEKATNA
jgi:hypothetical protein